MKKFHSRLTSALLFISLTAQTFAQNNGILFEIKGKDIKGTSYLMGTVPLADKNKYAFDQSILKYIDGCDKVVTEIDFVNGIKELTDSASLADFSFRVMARYYNSYINEVYLPAFATSDGAEKSLLALMGTGGSSLTQLENMYASKLGIKTDIEQWQWPNLKVVQYAVKKNKPYGGLQSIDSVLLRYFDYMKLNDEIPKLVAKTLKDIPADQQKHIVKQIPAFIAGGKADNLFGLLKHLKDGSDTLLLQMLNIHTTYYAEKLQNMMKEQTVFSAVNWFALTNPKGILQKLRAMGYSVKAVKMKTNAVAMYSAVKAVPYETTLKPVTSADGFLQFIFPGTAQSIQTGPYMNSYMYFDLVNKSSYTVARIKHNYTFKGKDRSYILKKLDSLLYEKVPGVIEKKELLENEFYNGYDIVSFNRKDDYMRFRFYVTPYEFVFVKCEGSGRYAIQAGADKYFESIKLNTELLKPQDKPGVLSTVFFKANVPAFVSSFNPTGFYHNFHESYDQKNNTAVIYMKGTYHSADYLDEDTFLLNSCITRFGENLDLKERSRTYGINQVTVKYHDEEGRYYTVRALRYGIHYYIVAASYPDSMGTYAAAYFDSFRPQNQVAYPAFVSYTDTALHFTVTTPEIAFEEPHSRASNLLQRLTQVGKNARYANETKKHTFTCFNTGETIKVDFSKYDEYTYFPDSIAFWNTIADNAGATYEYKISRKKTENKTGYQSHSFLLTDTNTSLAIKIKVLLKGRVLFVVSTGIDTLLEESPFTTTFFNTFEPGNDSIFKGSVFQPQTEKYLEALVSTDSATVAEALHVFPWYAFNKTHLEKLGNMLTRIPPKKEEREELAIKDRIMDIYGSIKEDAATDFLKQWYLDAGDTADIQVRLLSTLARQKTVYAMNTIKSLLSDNPPAARNSNQLGFFFTMLEDSAKLSAGLLPDLLPLLSNEDFKEDFLGFLAYMADSNYVEPKVYESKIQEILLQAKNELKRQNSNETEEETNTSYNILLVYYTKVLLPFYHTNEEVKSFIDKCLITTVPSLRQDIAYYMLKHNIMVPDSIWESLAKSDVQRYSLVEDLGKLKRIDKLPAKYHTQMELARATACNEVIYEIGKEKYTPEDLVYLSKRKVYFHQQYGYVYLFKVKSKGYDYESTEENNEWKLIVSGMQPVDTTKASLSFNLTYAANEIMDENKPIEEQFDSILRDVINARRHIKYSPNKASEVPASYDYDRYYED